MALWEDDELYYETEEVREIKRKEYLRLYHDAVVARNLRECSRLDREGSYLFPVRLSVAYYMDRVATVYGNFMEEQHDAR